jgi:hypothetical protein
VDNLKAMIAKKKPLVIALIATVASVGITAGVVFAQDNENAATPEVQQAALMDRACQIYEDNTGVAIDSAALGDAFNQAQEDMQAEAMDNQLQSLVEQGKITQEQADQYKEWWEARPDTLLSGGSLFGGGSGGQFGPGPGGPGGQCPPGDTSGN